MKTRFIVLLIIIFAGASSLNAQEKSSQPSFQEESLFYAGKIWGFVKYYHPEARVGKFDMDSLLVGLLDKSAETKTLKERNSVFNEWVSQFGKIKEFEKFIIKDSSQYKQLYDYSWLTNSTFDKKLLKKLLDIKDAKRTDSCYYAKLDMLGVPSFSNEKSIIPDFSKKHQKLIPLFRYWNIIEYYFPYKYLTDKKWDEVLKEYIPMFLKVANAKELDRSTRFVTTEINDGHSYIDGYYIYPYKKYSSPIALIYSKDSYIVKGFSSYLKTSGNVSDYGLEIGDEIVSINGRDPKEIILNDYSKYHGGSNINSLCNSLSSLILQSDTTFTEVYYKRNDVLMNGRVKAITYEYQSSNPISEEPFKVTTDSIAYINTCAILKYDIYDILHKVQKTKGLVLDIRGYPKTGIISALSAFVNPAPAKMMKMTAGENKASGNFKFIDFFNFNDYSGYGNLIFYPGKVVVLVDYNTISAAECGVMALQTAPNVITIGSQTAGADGNVTIVPLQNKIKVNFSSLGVYYPDGGETQRIGIRLDEEVYPTPLGIKEGRDEVIERAMEIVRTEKKKTSEELYVKSMQKAYAEWKNNKK